MRLPRVERTVCQYAPMIFTRLISVDHVPLLTRLERANREFFAPWSPIREEDFYSESGQKTVIADLLDRHRQGTVLPHVILDDQGQVVGRITVSGIVRGPLLSGNVGYWVNAADNGRGFATRAVTEIKRVAFDELGLHRLQAESLVENLASQRVLDRNGFHQFGLAPAYLRIAGRWQDCRMYEVLNPIPGCAH